MLPLLVYEGIKVISLFIMSSLELFRVSICPCLVSLFLSCLLLLHSWKVGLRAFPSGGQENATFGN